MTGKILHSFNVRDVILMVAISALMTLGFTQYVTPLEKAKTAAVEKLQTLSLGQYLEEDREAIMKFAASYEKPVRNCLNIAEVNAQMETFDKNLDKKFKTRKQIIGIYTEKLNKQISNIYSDKDKEAAQTHVKRFKKGAADLTTREDIDLLYTTAKQKVSTYKTIKQHKLEQKQREYLYGSWQIPGSKEYPFALNANGAFYMPIEKKTTVFERIKKKKKKKKKTVKTEQGNIGGTWELTSDKQVVIHITYNTLNENYKPYTWIFNYNTDSKTLEGTGKYYGWNYKKISEN